jgi:hypothetical protein
VEFTAEERYFSLLHFTFSSELKVAASSPLFQQDTTSFQNCVFRI